LKDILQEDVDEKYNCSELQIEKALSWKHQQDNIQTTDGKARTLVAWTHGNAAHYTKTLIDIVDGEVRVKQATKQWYIVAEEWDGISLSYPNSTTRRWRVTKWKSNTITTEWDSCVYEPKIAYAPWSREFKQQWWKTDKSPTICARDYKDPKVVMIPQMVRVRKYEVDIEWLKEELRSHKTISNKEIAERLDVPKTTVDHWFRIDSCFAIPDENIWFKLKDLLGITTDRFDKSITEFEERQWTYEKAERKIPVEWKMTTLTTSQNDEIINWVRIRRLTPIECERLQTLPDNYTEWVSDSQRYKMLGNWWTVDIIAHIFRFIK
jgi:site-specific DNA-cytosine methylase